jgi:small-conductance mechanosensitive channel
MDNKQPTKISEQLLSMEAQLKLMLETVKDLRKQFAPMPEKKKPTKKELFDQELERMSAMRRNRIMKKYLKKKENKNGVSSDKTHSRASSFLRGKKIGPKKGTFDNNC